MSGKSPTRTLPRNGHLGSVGLFRPQLLRNPLRTSKLRPYFNAQIRVLGPPGQDKLEPRAGKDADTNFNFLCPLILYRLRTLRAEFHPPPIT